MKNFFYTAAILFSAASLISCQPNGKGTADNSFAKDSTELSAMEGVMDAVQTDSVVFEKKNEVSDVKYMMEYPNDPSAPLTTAVLTFINKFFGETYEGNVANVQHMADFYGNKSFEEFAKQAKEEKPAGDMKYECSGEVRKSYESDKNVSFTANLYQFEQGAHGINFSETATFNKQTGKQFTAEMIKDHKSEAFQELLREGLRKYWEVKTDTELEEHLIEVKVNSLPLPTTTPYLTKEGMALTYNQYEIASYADGMPTAVIPFNKLKDILTAEGLEFIAE